MGWLANGGRQRRRALSTAREIHDAMRTINNLDDHFVSLSNEGYIERDEMVE